MFVFLFASLVSCQSHQLDRMLGRDRKHTSSIPSPAPLPVPNDSCIASAEGTIIDTSVPPFLDLTEATIITASLADDIVCSEIANVNSAGKFLLSRLAASEEIAIVNITVKINGTTTVFSRTYDSRITLSALADIFLFVPS